MSVSFIRINLIYGIKFNIIYSSDTCLSATEDSHFLLVHSLVRSTSLLFPLSQVFLQEALMLSKREKNILFAMPFRVLVERKSEKECGMLLAKKKKAKRRE